MRSVYLLEQMQQLLEEKTLFARSSYIEKNVLFLVICRKFW
jgi:hypothetical protein